MSKANTMVAHFGVWLIVCAFLFSAPPAFGQDDLPPGISPKGKATNFTEHVARINATDKFIDAYGTLEDDHPVIHLNFLQWRPRGNGERYGMYGEVAGKEIASLGGSTVHVGLGITDASKIYEFSDAWDEVAYALYPRKRAYLQLQRDQDYQGAIPDRVAGTYRRLIYAISDGEPIYNATNTILDLHKNKAEVIQVEKGSVVLSEFLRFKKNGGRESYTKFAKNFEKLLGNCAVCCGNWAFVYVRPLDGGHQQKRAGLGAGPGSFAPIGADLWAQRCRVQLRFQACPGA